jgi:hypothetical protein
LAAGAGGGGAGGGVGAGGAGQYAGSAHTETPCVVPTQQLVGHSPFDAQVFAQTALWKLTQMLPLQQPGCPPPHAPPAWVQLGGAGCCGGAGVASGCAGGGAGCTGAELSALGVGVGLGQPPTVASGNAGLESGRRRVPGPAVPGQPIPTTSRSSSSARTHPPITKERKQAPSHG